MPWDLTNTNGSPTNPSNSASVIGEGTAKGRTITRKAGHENTIHLSLGVVRYFFPQPMKPLRTVIHQLGRDRP